MVVVGQILVLFSPPQITHGMTSFLVVSMVRDLGGNCMNNDDVVRRL